MLLVHWVEKYQLKKAEILKGVSLNEDIGERTVWNAKGPGYLTEQFGNRTQLNTNHSIAELYGT